MKKPRWESKLENLGSLVAHNLVMHKGVVSTRKAAEVAKDLAKAAKRAKAHELDAIGAFRRGLKSVAKTAKVPAGAVTEAVERAISAAF